MKSVVTAQRVPLLIVQKIPGETMIVAIVRMLELIAVVSVKILITKYIFILIVKVT